MLQWGHLQIYALVYIECDIKTDLSFVLEK